LCRQAEERFVFARFRLGQSVGAHNVMWMGGVALASGQIAVSDPTAGGTLNAQGVNPRTNSGVDTSELLLHGMSLGPTYAW